MNKKELEEKLQTRRIKESKREIELHIIVEYVKRKIQRKNKGVQKGIK